MDSKQHYGFDFDFMKKLDDLVVNYLEKYNSALAKFDWSLLNILVEKIRRARELGSTVFFCGNGGSAANALHWANDLTFPVSKAGGRPLKALALTSDISTLTCLANDLGYEEVFRFQLQALAREGDILIVLSGSGNSPNIIRALEFAREKGLHSFAIVGFDGGKAKELANVTLHLSIDDMQSAEDFQLLVCHLVLKSLLNAG
ncbi:MAG: SIS domain-containing protein [Chthoniobacterales bacterium]|nr:SIS domain-containing protein [Chthoniobacterales bacterium]